MSNNSDHGQTGDQIIADKILWILQNFPTISPSMLQISLGSGIPTAVWQPVLEKLIQLKQVYRYRKTVTSPKGRTTEQIFISRKPDVKGTTVSAKHSTGDPTNAS